MSQADPRWEDPQRLQTALAYENRWMRVREDRLLWADGTESFYGVVEKPDCALVVPREDDGALWVVGQYRYPIRTWSWEFPQGSWEQRPNARTESVAAGELREETGLVADELRRVGRLHQAVGYSNQGAVVFLATGLRFAGYVERDERELASRRVTDRECRQMIASGQIHDVASVAALLLLDLLEA